MPSPPNEGEDQGASPMNGPSVGSYQSSGKRKVRTKKKKGSITANVSGTKYEIVRIVISEVDFMTRDDNETANLIWNDSAVQHEKIAELRNYQRINHFPGMGEICRKDCLARNMSKMIKCQPQEYSFIPKTWIFPAEYTQFQNYVKELRRKRKQKTFIVKPANGAMGHGSLHVIIGFLYEAPSAETSETRKWTKMAAAGGLCLSIASLYQKMRKLWHPNAYFILAVQSGESSGCEDIPVVCFHSGKLDIFGGSDFFPELKYGDIAFASTLASLLGIPVLSEILEIPPISSSLVKLQLSAMH